MDLLIHLIKVYGFLGIFASLMLGMFGLPIPDETILTFTGYLIFKNYLHPVSAGLAAFLGSICGITLNYLAGRYIGFPMLHKYGFYLRLNEEKLAQTRHWFEKSGKFALFGGYFFPGLRHLTAFSAGATSLPYRGFAPFAYCGGLCWVATFIAVGYFLGEEWQRIVPQIQKYLWLAVGLVILLAVGALLAHRLRGRNRPA